MNAPRLLVTRPLERQEPFSTRARELGFDALSFPCVRIVFDATAEIPSAEELEAADCVLFTSRPAVEGVAGRAPFPWTGASVVAIGRATAKALIDQGQTLVQAPVAPYTSEALLDTWKQSTAFEQVIVFKGRGGRTVLIDSLRQRGTVVTTVDVYRRERPCMSDAVRRGMLIERRPDVIAVTSDEILENLVVLAGEALQVLLPLPLVVNSDRCKTLARSCGFTGSIRVAATAGDEGQLAALEDWMKNRSCDSM